MKFDTYIAPVLNNFIGYFRPLICEIYKWYGQVYIEKVICYKKRK